MTKAEFALLSDDSLRLMIRSLDISLNHLEYHSRSGYRKIEKLHEKAIAEARRRLILEKPLESELEKAIKP